MGLLLGAWNGWWARTAKSLHLLSPSRACWHFAHTHWHHQRHDCIPHQRRDVTIGQSYLPASTGFIIGALGLRLLLVGNGAEECAVRLWVYSSGLYRSSRSPGFNRYHRIRRIWLLNDYRGVPTPVLLLTLRYSAECLWQRGRHLDDAFMPRRQSGSSTSLRD